MRKHCGSFIIQEILTKFYVCIIIKVETKVSNLTIQ